MQSFFQWFSTCCRHSSDRNMGYCDLHLFEPFWSFLMFFSKGSSYSGFLTYFSSRWVMVGPSVRRNDVFCEYLLGGARAHGPRAANGRTVRAVPHERFFGQIFSNVLQTDCDIPIRILLAFVYPPQYGAVVVFHVCCTVKIPKDIGSWIVLNRRVPHDMMPVLVDFANILTLCYAMHVSTCLVIGFHFHHTAIFSPLIGPSRSGQKQGDEVSKVIPNIGLIV